MLERVFGDYSAIRKDYLIGDFLAKHLGARSV